MARAHVVVDKQFGHSATGRIHVDHQPPFTLIWSILVEPGQKTIRVDYYCGSKDATDHLTDELGKRLTEKLLQKLKQMIGPDFFEGNIIGRFGV